MINQHKAMASLQKALDPAPYLIDGRTEKDWLCFLGRFAQLINFYDNKNNSSGSWEPLLLKDPVFLLASICRTDITELHTLYLDTCNNLNLFIQAGTDPKDIAASFNRLFDQLTSLFMYIKHWIYYMQRSGDEYELKTYIATEVKNTFSRYFWALLSLRQNLYLSSAIPGIEPVDTSGFYWFPQYDETIWKQNKDKDPYWQVLGLAQPIKKNKEEDFFHSLHKVGEKLFHFLGTIVRHADTAFAMLQKRKSHYPDTTLLRTFIHLLEAQQRQLNTITSRHLQFYYGTILHQHLQPASPDKVFLCASLAKEDAPFCLPGGTLFNAGLDALKNPVLFSTTADTTINPATITKVYTLASKKTQYGDSYFLSSISDPGLVKKDETGNVQTWETFGGTGNGTTPVMQGVTFASPLLLLREGSRTIILTVGFSENIPVQLSENASFYLSTATTWLKVKPDPPTYYFPNTGTTPTFAQIKITLSVTDPPVEAFTTHPDGINSVWPMLKIMFTSFFNPAAPPIINHMQLEVRVDKMKSVQLYNDYGSLSAKTPFALFGPVPAVNSNFIIGSNEIFSKPLTDLTLTFNWDTLPKYTEANVNPYCNDAFAQYYQQYNQYVWPLKTKEQPVKGEKKKWLSWFKCCKKPPKPPFLDQPFNNRCFRVTFQILQKQSWGDAVYLTGPSDQITANQEKDMAVNDKCLFAVTHPVKPECDHYGELLPISSYHYTTPGTFDCDATIQLSPLKFTDASTSGFMRMNLATPDYGFGASLYPLVIAQTAYANAAAVINDPKKPPTPFLVNQPFTPQVISFEISYGAQTDCFSGAYPFQCFQYTPFGSYAVPDRQATETDYQYTIGQQQNVPAGTSLHPPCLYTGYLFLEIENLIAAQATNLYFELIGSYASDIAFVDYFYMSKTGWKTLSVLSDGTNGLNCSGIVTVNIPSDIASQSQVMPGGRYWIAIATNRDPAHISSTVLLRTNGFVAQRTTASLPTNGTKPELAAQAITRPQFTIPQLATVSQPFSSFGGKAAENEAAMNLRVSNRLKVKDRTVSSGDYTGLIQQQFPDMYFSKTVFKTPSGRTGICAIRSVKNWMEPDAFVPHLTTCQQASIQRFIQERSSMFARAEVLNFDLQYVQVITWITIRPEYEAKGIQEKLNHLLNLFLSPWIKTCTPQTIIDQNITEVQVARCIRSIEGVADIVSIGFKTDPSLENISYMQEVQTVTPHTATSLLVSSMNHIIKCTDVL